MNITQIGKYKKLNMTRHKTDINITKIQECENKYMNITKYKKKTEYDGAQTDMNIT